MSAQVGDVITTAEELDALPVGSLVLTTGPIHERVWQSWADARGRVTWSNLMSITGHAAAAKLAELAPATLYLPGAPPRPERVVKAEALREAAATWAAGGWSDHLTQGWAEGRTRGWLLARADRIEAGETR